MTELIRREMNLEATPEEVWAALTDPDLLGAWLADEAWLELWPGGEARFVIDGRERAGWVEEAAAPPSDGRGEGRLTFWWADDGEPASRVELTLRRLDGGPGTRLRVVETRPLEVLDLVGVPLPGHGGRRFGPALVTA